jgi:ElaB/YqjD/DUF883 family membrane-anchored ribosome-binding protein
MGEDPSAGRAAVDPSDPDQIRAEIEQTREELGDTVAALSAKTDVKAQAQRRVQDTKATVEEKRDHIVTKAKEITPESAMAAASSTSRKARENPLPFAVAGAFLTGLLLGRLGARR